MSDTDNAIDKLDAHHRQQLSALLDGALPPDEAQFLLRRLQHDKELSACVGRWQLAGDVLRGRVDALLPAGFAGQVADAVAREQAPTRHASRPGWARGLGATALAASVALAAVLLTQRLPQQAGPDDTTPTIASAPVVSDPLQADPAATALDALPVDGPSSGPAGLAAQIAAPGSVAIGDTTPRRVAGRDPGSERQGDTGLAPEASAPAAVVAMATPNLVLPQPTVSNPFLPSTRPPARPWPRAVLSDFPTGATLAASYGADNGDPAASFYPFVPRLPPQAVVDESGDRTGPDSDPR